MTVAIPDKINLHKLKIKSFTLQTKKFKDFLPQAVRCRRRRFEFASNTAGLCHLPFRRACFFFAVRRMTPPECHLGLAPRQVRWQTSRALPTRPG